MAEKNRKKDSKGLFSFLRSLFVGLIILFVLFALGYKGFELLKKSSYFRVKEVIYSKSLQYVKTASLEGLKGRSIFSVDIGLLERQLRYRYPQASQLRIFRRFPNQIIVYAKERKPFLQARLNKTDVVLDEEGAILALASELDKKFPYVVGLSFAQGRPSVGGFVKDKFLAVAVKIIKDFRRTPSLAAYQIQKIEVGNSSQINFYMTNDLKIIVDQDDIFKKMNLLGLVLAQAKSQLEGVRYIDLRFKEPILGKN